MLFTFIGCEKEPEDETPEGAIKIAVLGPVSTSRAGLEAEYLACQLAAQEINAAGGVDGREIELILTDDGGDKAQGLEQVKALKEQGIDIIIGPEYSSVVLEIAPNYTIDNNMLVVSFSATNPEISHLDDNNLVWRTCPSDIYQGQIGAEYCYSDLGYDEIAILCMDNPWSIGLSNAFKSNFESLGGNVSVYEIFPGMDGDQGSLYDFSPHLDVVFDDKPDLVYMACFSTEFSKITNDIALRGYFSDDYRPILFSNDGPYTNNLLVNSHIDILEGTLGTFPGLSLNQANYKSFYDAYEEKWEFAPSSFSANAYDALYVVAYAILKSGGKTEPEEIAKYLQEVSGIAGTDQTVINVNEFAKASEIIKNGGSIDYNGASGNIDFDDNGDPSSGTYLIWSVENNEYVTKEEIVF